MVEAYSSGPGVDGAIESAFEAAPAMQPLTLDAGGTSYYGLSPTAEGGSSGSSFGGGVAAAVSAVMGAIAAAFSGSGGDSGPSLSAD